VWSLPLLHLGKGQKGVLVDPTKVQSSTRPVARPLSRVPPCRVTLPFARATFVCALPFSLSRVRVGARGCRARASYAGLRARALFFKTQKPKTKTKKGKEKREKKKGKRKKGKEKREKKKGKRKKGKGKRKEGKGKNQKGKRKKAKRGKRKRASGFVNPVEGQKRPS
jgi:hypothetical protein